MYSAVFASAPTSARGKVIVPLVVPRWKRSDNCDHCHPHTVGQLSKYYCLKEQAMGKYFLGWILGVPVIVLVAIYLFMH